jgi:cytochrome bd-type quinol oxidase subunit 1
MTRFWTRTRRYMTVLWLGTFGLEAVVLLLANRTNNSWFLVLAAALLVLPIAAMDATWRWFGREPRKRWKRHDLEDALAAGAVQAAAASAPAQPPAGSRVP